MVGVGADDEGRRGRCGDEGGGGLSIALLCLVLVVADLVHGDSRRQRVPQRLPGDSLGLGHGYDGGLATDELEAVGDVDAHFDPVVEPPPVVVRRHVDEEDAEGDPRRQVVLVEDRRYEEHEEVERIDRLATAEHQQGALVPAACAPVPAHRNKRSKDKPRERQRNRHARRHAEHQERKGDEHRRCGELEDSRG
eukprot:CAMPEP_0118853464 /NCGR_PEP_ID=MMETSP1163-20130328/2041_1 /TAXON_ID=124430 /ORGANISM="Phaeomonas parva, Strain CCMP2877" /LENGTH=193 /DNA_ID=CAMNT_0006786017 /DNA_START=277 /DNA_END=858 /DNA_ORIENTATION=-